MDTTETHGGKREGAGRPKGSLNKRSLEIIQEVAARFPDWSPLMHLTTIANDETLDVAVRLDAAKSAAPYVHAKLKPVDIDPDALVELERRLIHAKIEASATVLDNPGLAERMQRVKARCAYRHFANPD